MGRWGGGSKVGAASSHSPLQGATLYQIAWTNQGINIFTLSSRQYPHCCMRVHLCAWHTLNYKIITFLLSFPLALEPKPRNTTSIFFKKKNITLFVTSRRQSAEVHTHRALAETHCSLHNHLPCDTYFCCKWLFIFYSPSYLSLPAMHISCNYNSYRFLAITLQNPTVLCKSSV